MSIDGPGETTETSQSRSDGGSPGLLRALSLVAVVAGAVGSVGFMLRAGQRTPRLLLVLFTIWVLSPFAALLWGNIASKRWSAITRAALYCVTLVVTLGSLATYSGLVVLKPQGSANAFLFVAVPPVSGVFMTIVVAMAALVSRRLSRRSAGNPRPRAADQRKNSPRDDAGDKIDPSGARMATRDEALAALLSLDAAPVFGESYRQKQLPENLDIYFGPPEEFFLASDTQSPYTDGGLIPILDDGNFGIVTFLDPKTRTIVQKDVECPFEEYARFQNWQQYLGSLVINMAESIDDDERLRRMSDLVGYKYFDETLTLLDSLGNAPYEETERAKAGFLAVLRA